MLGENEQKTYMAFFDDVPACLMNGRSDATLKQRMRQALLRVGSLSMRSTPLSSVSRIAKGGRVWQKPK